MRLTLGRPMLASAVVIGTLLPFGALAQETATPGPLPQTPDAVDAQGSPADAATAHAVKAALLQVFACANAGDPLRFASLYTDQFLRDFFGGAPQADLEAFMGMAPQPLPAEQRRIIRGIGYVELLRDGRARVVIILDEPDDPRAEEPDMVVLRQVDGLIEWRAYGCCRNW